MLTTRHGDLLAVHEGWPGAIPSSARVSPRSFISPGQRIASRISACRPPTLARCRSSRFANASGSRLRLAFTHESIEAALNLQTTELTPAVTALLAHHLGRPTGDLDVQVLAYAFVGGLMGALRTWHDGGYTIPVEMLLERPLAILARGLDQP